MIGGPGGDTVRGGGSSDDISVFQGDRDRVFCGPGVDEVRASPNLVVAADCETVFGA